MSSRTLQNPLSRSVGIHLLLLLVAFFLVTHAPKLPISEPITIQILEPTAPSRAVVQKSEGIQTDHAKKKSYLSDQTRVTEHERSAARPGDVDAMGGSQTTVPKVQRHAENHSAEKEINLGDLGVKVQMTPKSTPYDQQRHWANAPMGEAIRGGQYIQGMKTGEVSALNTKEFVFYSYFDRVRKQLDQAWQPMLRDQIHQLYKKGRTLASNSDYVTKTMVTLNTKGEILRVQVLEQSGTYDLDQVAIDALNKAGPYPNPPRGLIGQDGTVQIRWDFVLKT